MVLTTHTHLSAEVRKKSEALPLACYRVTLTFTGICEFEVIWKELNVE